MKSCRTFRSLVKVMIGHQVGGRHLRLEEFLGGGLGANLVLDRHARHVEEHHQQAAVLYLTSPGLEGAI